MTTNDKRHFLDCRSLAEMAITLVAVGAILILPMMFLTFALGFILGFSMYVACLVPLGLWLLALAAMWLRFVRIGRSWSEPRLAVREFSYFQWAAIGFVLLLSLAFLSDETAPAINLIYWFFATLFVMVNLAYVSLAVAIRAEVPTKVSLALVVSIVLAILPIWMK